MTHEKIPAAADLLREISRICASLETDVQADWIFKRVQFLGYELTSIVGPELTAEQRLHLLNHYFFETKAFQAVADEAYSSDTAPLYLLHKVLCARVGSSLMVALVYSYLAQQIGISVEFVDLQPNCFLKYLDTGISRFIDLSKGGKTFSSDELIETIARRFKAQKVCPSNLCELVSSESVMVEFLRALKSAYQKRGDAEKVLELQNLLMNYQPNNFVLLGERAMLHRKLGKFKSAYNDLKRYFSFQERQKAPPDLVKLYDDLRDLFQNQKAQIEIID